jgi:LPXTG-site transpeptidase (sortase) family protein
MSHQNLAETSVIDRRVATRGGIVVPTRAQIAQHRAVAAAARAKHEAQATRLQAEHEAKVRALALKKIAEERATVAEQAKQQTLLDRQAKAARLEQEKAAHARARAQIAARQTATHQTAVTVAPPTSVQPTPTQIKNHHSKATVRPVVHLDDLLRQPSETEVTSVANPVAPAEQSQQSKLVNHVSDVVTSSQPNSSPAGQPVAQTIEQLAAQPLAAETATVAHNPFVKTTATPASVSSLAGLAEAASPFAKLTAAPIDPLAAAAVQEIHSAHQPKHVAKSAGHKLATALKKGKTGATKIRAKHQANTAARQQKRAAKLSARQLKAQQRAANLQRLASLDNAETDLLDPAATVTNVANLSAQIEPIVTEKPLSDLNKKVVQSAQAAPDSEPSQLAQAAMYANAVTAAAPTAQAAAASVSPATTASAPAMTQTEQVLSNAQDNTEATETVATPDLPNTDGAATLTQNRPGTITINPAKMRANLTHALSKLNPRVQFQVQINTRLLGKVLRVIAVLIILGVSGFLAWDTWMTNKTVQETFSQPAAAMSIEDTNPANVDTTTVSNQAYDNYTVPADQPRYIEIPAIGVKARVMSVGVTSSGNVASPTNVNDTAWYDGSAKPGQDGEVFINGHTGFGVSAVFNNLPKLKAGDQITIEMGDGTKYNYKVTEVAVNKVSDVDMNKVLSVPSGAKQGLSLMTCTGTYNYRTQSSDERAVVYAVRE